MSHIGSYEAKTHLPALLERVEHGERFIITRHGKPVAELTPYSGHDTAAALSAVAEVRKLRTALKRKGVTRKDVLGSEESLRDLSHFGHRY